MPLILTAQVTLTPTFDTITVVFDVWDEPYQLRAHLFDTSRTTLEPYEVANYLSFSGYAKEATRVMEQDEAVMEMDTARYTHFRDSLHPTAALLSLLADAEAHEIVIINEAHHEPRHRVFTRQLLRGLYDRGYRHFGMEGLVQQAGTDSLTDQSAYPSLNSGYLTREPQFAAMVAEAQRIGYRIFGYEAAGTGSPKLREIGQTKNIMDYRTAHPDGKLLLHVGYSHAAEGELDDAREKAMAQRLADTTGLDPLTVNQTHFREMSDTMQERYEYRHFAPAEPSLCVTTAGEHFTFGDGKNWFDRYVFHPRTRYLHGRPDYVFTFDQQPVYIDFSHIDTEGPWLVRAYALEDDMSNVVPRDVVELDGSPTVALALGAGAYRLLVTSLGGAQRVGRIVVE